MMHGTPLLLLNGRPPAELLKRLRGGQAAGSVLLPDAVPVEEGPEGEAWRKPGDLWAADGGANALWRAGLVASAIVGDFDSLFPEARDWHVERGALLLERPDQHLNDLEKALACLAGEGATRCWVAGFEGGRLDMLLGLTAWLGPEAAPRLRLLGEEQIVQPLTSGDHVFLMDEDEAFSLVVLGSPVDVDVEGARWCGAGLRIEPGCRAVSNRALGGRLRIAVRQGRPLLIRQTPWAGTGA